MYMLISACAQWQRDVDSGRRPNHQNAQPLAGKGEVGDMRVDVQAIPDCRRGRSRFVADHNTTREYLCRCS
jgi:hypothetical protein